jgi:hypothetical protein
MAITRESIWAAADQLVAEGVRPTQALIRERLGGGSFTTISSAMADWHARQTQKTAPADPIPDKLSEAATEFAAVTWRIAQELADAQLQARRSAIEGARQQMEAEKIEAAAFADQLVKELDTLKEKSAALVERLDTADSTIRALLAERDQERARADRAQAVADERSRTIDALQRELIQVRKDKEAEIARLTARPASAKPPKPKA